ncbi:hypothetical protein KJ068_13885 [bacterium]|nr:MAG: hypothetical protein EDS67_11515 [candidate division KSB1 bacterium]MBC6947375.1 hypothetical protein [candidate division KSB1 bacterium]MCE7942153.1 hypothetical protein [Chlorobi bacterium CHB1]MCL4706254.1 hypothetical protein [bacterium]MDL1873953.1 hypothetical protein [Cytophagia bacterium CHB2]
MLEKIGSGPAGSRNEIAELRIIRAAIEIAKKFSTEKSGRFVNGILDAALIDLRKAGQIRKKGRGLSDGPKRDVPR